MGRELGYGRLHFTREELKFGEKMIELIQDRITELNQAKSSLLEKIEKNNSGYALTDKLHLIEQTLQFNIAMLPKELQQIAKKN